MITITETVQVTEQEIPLEVVELLTGRGFITGKSGSGKSNTAGVISEELLKQGYPLLIVDTEGEYYGLKEQFEILHVGADEECDLQVSVEHAEKIAELALDENIPVILDVSGYLETEESKEIIKETLHHLFTKEKKLKKPFLVLIEEVHEYVPEGPSLDECGEMIVRVAKRGRKRGLGIVGMSQRPADVKKDFITQCNWRVWHRLDWENDLAVVRRVLGKDYENQVKGLSDGEGILECDFLDNGVQTVQFNRKETFDAGETPDLEDFERPELKSVSQDLVEELQEISEEKRREQDRIEELERNLAEKEDEIEELEEELDRAQDMSDIAQQFTEAMASGGSAEVQEKVEEIREEKNSRIRELEKELETAREDLEEYRERAEELEEFEEYREKVEEWEERRDVLQEALLRVSDVLDIEIGEDVEKYRERIKKLQSRVDELESGNLSNGSGGNGFVGSEEYERLIKNMGRRSRTSEQSLDKVMQELDRGEANITQLSTATGLAKSTLRKNVLPALKKQGWVEKQGDRYRISEEV